MLLRRYRRGRQHSSLVGWVQNGDGEKDVAGTSIARNVYGVWRDSWWFIKTISVGISADVKSSCDSNGRANGRRDIAASVVT
jgi:hypothetical protein